MLEETNVSNNKITTGKVLTKAIIFSIFLILSPFIFIVLLWIGFKVLVINETLDIKPLFTFLANKIKNETVENSEEDIDYYDENDYTLVDYDDLTIKKN